MAMMPSEAATTDAPAITTSDQPPAPQSLDERPTLRNRILASIFGPWGRREDDPLASAQASNTADSTIPSRPRTYRRVVPGLPRPQTFSRQDSERRDRLLPHQPCESEKKLASVSRRRAVSAVGVRSPVRVLRVKRSAPEVNTTTYPLDHAQTAPAFVGQTILQDANAFYTNEPEDLQSQSIEPPPELDPGGGTASELSSDDEYSEGAFQQDLEQKWILNLSMTFKDGSDREKFFVTYAEQPNRWRKVTVSCDYRKVPRDSLEAELRSLPWQRDKSAAIYRAIRKSLPEINFFDTVTNLKLQTSDDRLHVHVTEDVNEIIPYPDVSAVKHLEILGKPLPKFKECELEFDAHISGFVYRVEGTFREEKMIKKEIPGPDMVDEFLYEINALAGLVDAQNVIDFVGVVVDDAGEKIRGLLISFAEQGALVDILFDRRDRDDLVPWNIRERWAKQVVAGLADIHDHGFVQGDFTLSNIVVDERDNALIIDINRRGCPVGWEPPEFKGLIRDAQRVGMYIGVKSDLYQLGMVLYGIADHNDEPERKRVLDVSQLPDEVPQYFRDIIQDCLADHPTKRPPAARLLKRFPDSVKEQPNEPSIVVTEHTQHNATEVSRYSEREYIDPQTAVTHQDIEEHRRSRARHLHPSPSEDWTNGGLSDTNNTISETSPESRYNVASSKTSAAPPSAIIAPSAMRDPADCMPNQLEELRLDGEPRGRSLIASRLPNRIEQQASQIYGNIQRSEDLESRPETLRKVPLSTTSLPADEQSTTPKPTDQCFQPGIESYDPLIGIRRVQHQDSGFDELLIDELSRDQGSNEASNSNGGYNWSLAHIGAHMS